MEKPKGYPSFDGDNADNIAVVNDGSLPDGVPEISSYEPTSGRKRALIIGINYSGRMELKGCVNDAVFMTYLLRTRFGFEAEDIQLMTDEPHTVSDVEVGSHKPTFKNILEKLAWLMRDSHAGDSLFFYFSGHGTRILDTDGDEPDGQDEVLCPVDTQEGLFITDDYLYHNLVKRVPVGARLTCVVDTCHSGTILDCPYLYDLQSGDIFDHRQTENVKEKHVQWLRKWGPISKYTPRTDSTGGEAICMTASRDNQYSEDSRQIADVPVGTFTYCLIQAIERQFSLGPDMTFRSVLLAVTDKVQVWSQQWSKPQTPELSTAHKFNIYSPFLL